MNVNRLAALPMFLSVNSVLYCTTQRDQECTPCCTHETSMCVSNALNMYAPLKGREVNSCQLVSGRAGHHLGEMKATREAFSCACAGEGPFLSHKGASSQNTDPYMRGIP